MNILDFILDVEFSFDGFIVKQWNLEFSKNTNPVHCPVYNLLKRKRHGGSTRRNYLYANYERQDDRVSQNGI